MVVRKGSAERQVRARCQHHDFAEHAAKKELRFGSRRYLSMCGLRRSFRNTEPVGVSRTSCDVLATSSTPRLRSRHRSCWLGEVQPGRRPPEVQLLGDRQERFGMPEVHRALRGRLRDSANTG
jgi:hypothetical protein